VIIVFVSTTIISGSEKIYSVIVTIIFVSVTIVFISVTIVTGIEKIFSKLHPVFSITERTAGTHRR
jgi:hypothetical protein